MDSYYQHLHVKHAHKASLQGSSGNAKSVTITLWIIRIKEEIGNVNARQVKALTIRLLDRMTVLLKLTMMSSTTMLSEVSKSLRVLPITF